MVKLWKCKIQDQEPAFTVISRNKNYIYIYIYIYIIKGSVFVPSNRCKHMLIYYREEL